MIIPVPQRVAHDRKVPWWAWTAVGLLGVGAVGCAAEKTDSTRPVASSVKSLSTSGSTSEAPVTSAPIPPVPTVPSATAANNPFGGNSPEDFLVPDVMCMNLQQAQDEIQDHGVFLSESQDATGQGRMQINDSNWQVVAQSPAPGTPFGEGDALLSVVKYGEGPNPCP